MATGHRTVDTQSTGTAKRRFHFNWKMALFTLLLLPVMINLGLWQLDREQEKIAAQERYNARLQQVPVDLSSIDWSNQDLGWTRIRAQGSYLTDKQFLLDNRIVEGRPGYEVLTPFGTIEGIVLVNRGWVPQGATRSDLPSLEMAASEDLQITGHIYVPDGETMLLGANVDSQTDWPRVIQRTDITMISEALGNPVFPHIVRLAEDSAGALRINWAAINMKPEVHRGYAIQWFLMAFALIILYLVFSFRKVES